MNPIKIFLFLIIIPSITSAQSVTLGLKLESYYYSYKNTRTNNTEVTVMPIPFSGYLKLGILFDNKYEAELKGGAVLGESFTGPEYAVIIKYQLIKNIFPSIIYLNHSNKGHSGNSSGTHSNNFQFIGFGFEGKLTRVFGIDLIYYIPFGEKGLDYVMEFNSGSNKTRTVSEISSLVKLGFIFNINL